MNSSQNIPSFGKITQEPMSPLSNHLEEITLNRPPSLKLLRKSSLPPEFRYSSFQDIDRNALTNRTNRWQQPQNSLDVIKLQIMKKKLTKKGPVMIKSQQTFMPGYVTYKQWSQRKHQRIFEEMQFEETQRSETDQVSFNGDL